MKISHIVAMAQNGVIGNNGALPWHIPEDLKYFREKTQHHSVIMGRKTFESVGSKPLSNRLNVVLSRQTLGSEWQDHASDEQRPLTRLFYAHHLDEALSICERFKKIYGEEIFICGGGELYRQSLNRTSRIYLTLIRKEFVGNTTYPEIDIQEFKEIYREPRDANDVRFDFIVYERFFR